MIRRLALLVIITLGLAVSAEAHRLKLFVRTDAGAISGYGFFIGGGRPEGAVLVIRDAAGKEVYRGNTLKDGSFSWRPATAGRYVIELNTGEGHISTATVEFGNGPSRVQSTGEAQGGSGSGEVAALDDRKLAALIEAAVDRAVGRRIEPLRESIERYEASLRFKDVVSGIAMIIGLAGIAMWFLARKSRG